MQTQTKTLNIVTGKLTNPQNQPLPNLLVQVYNRDMRSEQLLAETVTDKEGNYAIEWQHNYLFLKELS